jgi:phosphatidylglycerol:prolipoprotein diacylglycerol transferase
MLGFTPNPIAFQVGPIPVYWYGICYAAGLALAYVVMAREARRRGFDVEILANGMIVVAIAALIGGRAYHVIDQWQLYKDDLLKIVLPPYSGLGVYGGLATGVLAAVLYTRWRGVSFWPWVDVVAPGLFVMQAVGRWGNFFNQELYGPPTTLPWGIPIDCAHRVDFPCTTHPFEFTRFHPLFLYESISGILGALFLLWLARRYAGRLRDGDLLLVFFLWYPTVRFLLESMRTGNWRLGGVPTAQIVSIVFALIALIVLLYRHRSAAAEGHPEPDPFAEEDAAAERALAEEAARSPAAAGAATTAPTATAATTTAPTATAATKATSHAVSGLEGPPKRPRRRRPTKTETQPPAGPDSRAGSQPA